MPTQLQYRAWVTSYFRLSPDSTCIPVSNIYQELWSRMETFFNPISPLCGLIYNQENTTVRNLCCFLKPISRMKKRQTLVAAHLLGASRLAHAGRWGVTSGCCSRKKKTYIKKRLIFLRLITRVHCTCSAQGLIYYWSSTWEKKISDVGLEPTTFRSEV